ncbi:LysR family transcriptional regulator [soil metagenome]
MQIPRRFMPSITLLTAFETAARTLSFTIAAEELNLTQSAVSRQIRALEEQLGVELFARDRQAIKLTLAGESYAREIRDALRRIGSASLNLRANPLGGTLNLAILPTFGTRWLAPRLPDFLAKNGGITINLGTRITQFDFNLDPFDAAIHFGTARWPGAKTMFLMGEDVMPMASPSLVKENRVRSPEDILHLPMLHLVSRPDAWERWFQANGLEVHGITGMLFDQFATISQAVIAGLGVALLPLFLIENEMSRGELVPILNRPMRSMEDYYLVWPRNRESHAPLVAFRTWIAAIVDKHSDGPSREIPIGADVLMADHPAS